MDDVVVDDLVVDGIVTAVGGRALIRARIVVDGRAATPAPVPVTVTDNW
ncbi:hypothetical protein NKH18_18040 [Streptomyces sp. M10(2022)]